MKIKYFLFLTLVFFSFESYGQNFQLKIDSIVKLEIKALQNSGIDTLGFYRNTDVGYGYFSMTYLFWKKNDSTHIQKFKDLEFNREEFKKSKSVFIENSIFFNFYNINKASLDNEKVKSFRTKPDSSYTVSRNGNITTFNTGFRMKTHSSYSAFFIKPATHSTLFIKTKTKNSHGSANVCHTH